VFALLRGQVARGARESARGVRGSALAAVPRYLFGYIAFALLRATGDRLWPGSAAWATVLTVDRWAVDLLLVTVAASIGLHLQVGTLLASGARAGAVGAAAATWMAGLTLGMVVATARGTPSGAVAIGGVALLMAYMAWRLLAGGDRELGLTSERFASGQPLSLAEVVELLGAADARGEVLDDAARRRLLAQLHPTIGELIPARESPLRHGDGSRWTTYWHGKTGWALVAVCRDPASATPIHAHPHALLARTIEGTVEELRFDEEAGGQAVRLGDRRILAHDELVESSGSSQVHVIRVIGQRTAIDLQLRGPEEGRAGRHLRPLAPLDLATLTVGDRVAVAAEADARPGHGGEGPAAGAWMPPG
jgi:hypothetical protein